MQRSPKRCKGVHCVDLDESFQTHIYLQNLASIQPRTGSRGELRRWGLLHAGDGVLDRGSDGLLGTWITIDYRAATNLAATRAQGVSLQRLPKRKHARVEPLRITARARTRRTTRTLPSDLLRGQRRWDAFAPSSRAKPCPASFHLVDQRPVYLDME